MKISEIEKRLIDVGVNLQPSIEFIRIYLFGSVLVDPAKNADVDILIVYRKPGDVSMVRKAFGELSLEWPLHLLFLTCEELTESDFFKKYHPVLVFQVE